MITFSDIQTFQNDSFLLCCYTSLQNFWEGVWTESAQTHWKVQCVCDVWSMDRNSSTPNQGKPLIYEPASMHTWSRAFEHVMFWHYSSWLIRSNTTSSAPDTLCWFVFSNENLESPEESEMKEDFKKLKYNFQQVFLKPFSTSLICAVWWPNDVSDCDDFIDSDIYLLSTSRNQGILGSIEPAPGVKKKN